MKRRSSPRSHHSHYQVPWPDMIIGSLPIEHLIMSMSKSLWRIFQSTYDIVNPFFLCLLSNVVPCRMVVLGLVTCPCHLHFLFLVWWRLALRYFCCCLVWFYSISFGMLRFFTIVLLLMSKIRRHTWRLGMPMHARVWSLISMQLSFQITFSFTTVTIVCTH